MPKVLLVGNGAREHIIATKLKENKDVALFCFANKVNPGIKKLSDGYKVGDLYNNNEITSFAKKEKIQWACIGPDDPLANGVVDALLQAGIPSFGPNKQLDQIESSKSFARDLLVKHQIEVYPKFKLMNYADDARAWTGQLNGEFVIKSDGLTGGKGVWVQGDHFSTREEGLAKISEVLRKDGKVLLEEKLVGQEFSFMTITDGKDFIHLPAVQDHKRAFAGDAGPNTGGMGSYSDSNFSLPFLSDLDIKQAKEVNEKVIKALYNDTGLRYKGVLYGGFMAVKDGVKLIEYNARFGDPEAMNVLSILNSDFTEICEAVIEERLGSLAADFQPLATVCKYVVPEGYPINPVKNEKIDVSGVDQSKVELYFAAVDEKDDGPSRLGGRAEAEIYMSSSRAVAVVGKAATIEEAERMAEDEIGKIKGRVSHRSDIGTKELVAKRVEFMKKLRS